MSTLVLRAGTFVHPSDDELGDLHLDVRLTREQEDVVRRLFVAHGVEPRGTYSVEINEGGVTAHTDLASGEEPRR